MNTKKWSICFLIITFALLLVVGLFTAVIDPFFHYHAPLSALQYPINNQRYQNDGITKHFTYDAVITGTSMTENFMASECNELFSVNAIKVSYSGGLYKEINDNVQNAIDTHPELRMVFRSLDGSILVSHKDDVAPNMEYPDYLYDSNWFNDVNYLLNKDVLFKHTVPVLDYTNAGYSTTSFDEYSNWNDYHTFNKSTILESYNRPDKVDTPVEITDDVYQTVTENLVQNAISIAQNNPNIDFYYYFPPYSIFYWDSLNQKGMLQYQVQVYTHATELLLQAENIHLFSFFEEFDLVTNPDNYKDYIHHSQEINSMILQHMKTGEHRLTADNYAAHWRNVLDYYQSYDYESLFSDN